MIERYRCPGSLKVVMVNCGFRLSEDKLVGYSLSINSLRASGPALLPAADLRDQ